MTKTPQQKDNAETIKTHRTNSNKLSEIFRTAREYPTMKEDEAARIYYYNNHPEQAEFILDFFKVSNGIRPRGAQYTKKDGGHNYEYTNRITRDIYGGKYSYPITDLNDRNIALELRVYKNFYFFPIIYDKSVRQCNSKFDLKNHMIGITPIMDVDSPDIDPNDKSKGRINLIEKSNAAHKANKLIDKFRRISKSELSELGLWDKTRLIHSGNGMYIILPDFYGSITEMLRYADAFYDLKSFINHEIGMELTHEKRLYWGQLFKIPFTFHNKYHRVSIPINKDKPFGYKLDTSGWQ